MPDIFIRSSFPSIQDGRNINFQAEEPMEEIQARSFGLFDIIGKGTSLFFENIKSVLIIGLITSLPTCLVSSYNTFFQRIHPETSYDLQCAISLLGLICNLISIIGTSGMISIYEKSVFRQKISWTDALKFGVSKWGNAVITSILSGLIILGLSLLLIVPGIIWSQYYAFFIYVVVLKNLSGKTALDYSKDLVKGQWWRVFGINLAIALLWFGIAIVVGICFRMIGINYLTIFLSSIIALFIGCINLAIQSVFFLNIDALKHPVPSQSYSPYGVETIESMQ